MRLSHSALACVALATGALALPTPPESSNPSFNLVAAGVDRIAPVQLLAHTGAAKAGQGMQVLSRELGGDRVQRDHGEQNNDTRLALKKRQTAAIVGWLGLAAAASSSDGGSGSWEWDATDSRNLGIALGCVFGVPLLIGLTWCACKARKKRRARKEEEREQAAAAQTPAYSTVTPLPFAYLPSKSLH